MSFIEELDYRETPLGMLVLRRRVSPSVPDEPVYEVKLNDELLMSSVVHASERALARLALEPRGERPADVLVGGLGLGYTAATALEFDSVRRLVVIEYLAPVIGWHTGRLVPMADVLLDDPRCSLVEDDFFARVSGEEGGDRYDVILLDIDHSPESLLHPRHGSFYTPEGLGAMARHLRPGGVFGLWSASEPPSSFLSSLSGVLPDVDSREVSFPNPHLGETDTNWIVLAR